MALNIRHKDSVNEVDTDNPDESKTNKCGHLLSYSAYTDSDGCVICDKQMIGEMIE